MTVPRHSLRKIGFNSFAVLSGDVLNKVGIFLVYAILARQATVYEFGALSLGLIDQIGYLEDALAAARGASGLKEARVVTYHRPRQYRATIYSSADPSGPTATLPDLARMVVSGPRFLYLWWP